MFYLVSIDGLIGQDLVAELAAICDDLVESVRLHSKDESTVIIRMSKYLQDAFIQSLFWAVTDSNLSITYSKW
jgi:hypothetical protein